MKKESVDLPIKLAELIGDKLISSISRESKIPKYRWAFDMFLDLSEPNAFKLDHWIIKKDHNTEPTRVRVNFDYSPYKENEYLRDLAKFYMSYYKLNKMFAELSSKVNWPLLKTFQIADGLNFESWITFFELSYPEDHVFYLTTILKQLENDQTGTI